MPLIKKYGEVLPQPLSSFGTFVSDTDANSTYFRITELKETFTGGKNGFLIEGSPFLKETTEIKIQILDVEGNPIYWEPGNGIPEYYEGTSKIVSVHIYDDTPIGDATITILGELKEYLDDGKVVRDIPDDWKGVYNVKWQKTIKVNKLLANEDRVRFYRRPRVTIDELVKPLFSTTIPTIVQTGSLDGTAITPQSGQKLSDYTLPTLYRLTLQDNTNWTGSVLNTRLSVPGLNYNPLITQIVTNKEVLTSDPYTINGIVESFDNIGYTASFQHLEGTSNLKTALTGSFAKITISDLTTFIGDVVSVDVYRKSRSKIGDFEFVQKVILESNEILKDYNTTDKNEENYGILTSDIISNYWVSSSNNTVSFNQNYLYNSAELNVASGVGYFHTTQSFSLNTGGEYTLDFNVRKKSITSTDDYIEFYISGSRQSSNPLGSAFPSVTVPVQQLITKIQANNQVLQKVLISENFEAEQIDNAKLYVDVKGTEWYISDISIKASQETSFSPNELTVVQSVPRSLVSERFDYLFKFYDINGNYIPVNVEASKEFDGGNIQRIEKKLDLNPSSLYFQFDSGSQPVPPTVITFNIEKTLLTGSVNFTSSSIDFFGNVLSASQYVGGVYPGLLDNITGSVPFLTVGNFTGSRNDIDVQLITFTGECEGVTDTVTITAVLDGFGGVNHIIRPYRGTQIRNSSTASLEIQAVRIDGINDIELYSGSRPDRGWNLIQLHVLSSSFSGSTFVEKFVNLEYASASGFVQGLTKGTLGTGEINFNATFNRDSIDKRRTIYLMSSASAASDWAFNTSASVLASQILEDLQDGLDTPVVTYNTDTFTINFRNEIDFRPVSASATASFYLRGTNENPISASILVYPSMSINRDFAPEYWLYWVSQSKDSNISIVAADETGRSLPARLPSSFIGSPLSQSKVLVATFTYTEPYTLTEISIDKTFTIVPEGKPGDETVVFELTPSNVTLNANAKGDVATYTPANTELKLKQGARYLSFSSSKEPGNFWLNTVTQSMILTGSVDFNNTSSLLLTGINNMTELSASLTYDLLIHPYFTSSRYTQSLVQNFTKAVDGAPPIEIIVNPQNAILSAFETGYIKAYTPASTSIELKEGNEYLIYTSSQQRGTWHFQSITGSNIQTASISSPNSTTPTRIGSANYTNFLPPYVSASAFYNLRVYPYSLLPGHRTGSVNLFATQSFTKNSDAVKARTVKLSTSTNTVNFDGDTVVISPVGDITFTATPINITSSQAFYQWFKYDPDSATYGDLGYGISTTDQISIGSSDATSAGETAVFRVEMRDGSASDIIRAVDEITIFGVKAGADSFTANVTNENTSIQVSLWETAFTGSGTQIRAFKAGIPLIHTSSYVSSQIVYYEYGPNSGLPIGNLGYYSASIHSKSSYITVNPQNRLLGNPAEIGDVSSWVAPAVNTAGTVVYKVDFENGRKSEFYSQSFSSQITAPAPYNATLTNENSSIIYRVSGEIEYNLTPTTINVYRGDVELTNTGSLIAGQETHTDMYGEAGWKEKCRVSIYAKSAHITLSGSLTAGSFVSGSPAVMGGITQWLNPEVNQTAFIVYQIDCEGRDFLYKTQSLSVQYEGNTGPGIVMRGIWKNDIDYIGSDISGNRRDAVIHPDPATNGNITQYYGAIQESGPGTAAGIQAPTGTTSDNAYWQYLGNEEFFVAAQIAIFQESYVKNTINVGTKDGSGAFANIVIAGGRPDPYIAIGQTGTQGTAGTSGTSLATPGIIGYNRPGVFLGLYEDGTNGTTGRFSIKTTGTSGKGMFWDGDQLTIVGSIRQRQPGIPEGSFRGAWTDGITYYEDDTVTAGGASYICGVSHTSTFDTNINTGYPANATNSWSVYAAAGTSGVSGTSGLSGTNGANGAGVVYRGLFSTSTNYFHTTERRDIVKQGSTYYLVNDTSKNGQLGTIWGSPPNANWTTFGAQFSSVATDVLFAVEQYVDKSINIGAKGANALIVLNANESGSNANPYISIGQISSSIGPGSWVTESQVQGFNNPGIFIGYDTNQPKVSLIGTSGSLVWNGEDLTIQGSISSNDGQIGGWTIGEGSIISANQNIQLYSDPSESIAVFDDSGSLRFFANTQLTLPSPTGVVYSSSTLPTVSTSSLQTNGVPNDGTYVPGSYGLISYVYYIIPSSGGSFTALTSGQHIITYTMPFNFSSYARATGDAAAGINVNLQLTTTGHAPQFFTEQVGQSNYATAYANGSIQSFQIWNGFGWDTSYYPTTAQMELSATKFSLIADLQQGVTYYLTLRVGVQNQSIDTSLPSYPPFGIDSEAETSFVLASAGNISIKAISAGTVVNGGGFQAVLADDKYLRVRDGISGSYSFSNEITGSLMVDRAISRFSNGYGYPPAVKAFGTIRYDGGGITDTTKYTILNRYNISTSFSIGSFNIYDIVFTTALDSNDYIILFTTSNLTYATQEVGSIAVITGKNASGFSFRIERPNHNNPGIATTYIGGNLGGHQSPEIVDFVVLSR
jgi:hypothetical protein